MNDEQERDWMDKLILNNLTTWFGHKPGTKIGRYDYKFGQNDDVNDANSNSSINKRIKEIESLSVRCRDSDGEKHGVDHNCISCKPWLILKGVKEGKEEDETLTNNDNNLDQDTPNDEDIEEILNFYSHHSIKNKTWLCSLCQKRIPIDIKTCICIGGQQQNNHSNNNHFKHHNKNNNNQRDKERDNNNNNQNQKPNITPRNFNNNNSNITNNNLCINKDCLMVIKELAEVLHVSIQFNQISQDNKKTAKPFEYEICFNGIIISSGVGNSKRKAQRNAAEYGLIELRKQGHGQTINLLEKFGRIGHCEIDRNLYVEICRDISDQLHLYQVKPINLNEQLLFDKQRLMKQIIIDECIGIKAYQTREWEISQLEEPSVLACVDGTGSVNKSSLVPGIFHKDVNNGRYGYNPRNYYYYRHKNNGNGNGNGNDQNEVKCDGNNKSSDGRTKKKKKRRRNSKRKKNMKNALEIGKDKQGENVPISTTEQAINTINDESTNDDKSVNTNTTDSTIQTQDIPPNITPNVLQFPEEKEKQEALPQNSEMKPSVSNVTFFTTENIIPSEFEINTTTIPNRRHSYGSSTSSTSKRHKNSYSHPSKYQFHHIYYNDDISPESHRKHNGKSNRRRRRHSAMKHNKNNKNNNHNGVSKKHKNNKQMDEHSLLENDDVYTCSECGKYFADNLNGKYLSETVPKWYCFQCIKRMNDSHLKPFIEMSVYTQRKNMLDMQHKELSVTPPMTPPSSDDDGNGNNSKNSKMHKNPSIKPKNFIQFSRKHSRSPDKRKRGNFYGSSPNKKHGKTNKHKNGKKQQHRDKSNKIRRNSLKQNNNEQKRKLPPKSHTTMSCLTLETKTAITPSNPFKAKSASPTKIRIPDPEPQIKKSRSFELMKETKKEKEEKNNKTTIFKSESPELVIQDIIDTEFSDMTFLGPQTPSSPSLTDKEFGHKIISASGTKISASDKDIEDNEDNEEDDDSNSDDDENTKTIATVSVATQVTDKNIADKATQATTPRDRDITKTDATTPTSTTVSSTESSNISSPSHDNEEENDDKKSKKQKTKMHALKKSHFIRAKPRHKYKHNVNGSETNRSWHGNNNKYKDKYLNNIAIDHNHHHYYQNGNHPIMYNPYNNHQHHHHPNNIFHNSQWNAYYGQTQHRDHGGTVFMMNNYVHSHHHRNHNNSTNNNPNQQNKNINNNNIINGYQTYPTPPTHHI